MSTLSDSTSPGLMDPPVSMRPRPRWNFVVPNWKDPRCTLAVALTLWTVLGQTAYFFNRNLSQLVIAVITACVLDFIILAISKRELALPLSAYITALSVGLLLESY